MTTHQPPYMPGRTTDDRGMPRYHRLPHYLNDAPEPTLNQRASGTAHFAAAAHVTNAISDREESDRVTRSDALDSAVRIVTEVPGLTDGLDLPEIEHFVMTVADHFAHYIASGVVPPRPYPAPGLDLPLKLESESSAVDSSESRSGGAAA